MTTEEQKTITDFVAKIANKDYAGAQPALQAAVEAKIKSKVQGYISREEN